MRGDKTGPNVEQLTQLLSRLREEPKVSASELARRTFISKSEISRIQSGKLYDTF
jgi:transcriptional regulator with XRE-family HTH domain